MSMRVLSFLRCPRLDVREPSVDLFDIGGDMPVLPASVVVPGTLNQGNKYFRVLSPWSLGVHT